MAQICRFCEALLLPSAGYLCVPFWFAAIVRSRQVPVMADSLCMFPFRWSQARWSLSKPGLGLSLAQRPERRAKLFGKELRLFPGGEVAALGGLVEVDEVGVDLLGPAARGLEDLAGEDGEADREL